VAVMVDAKRVGKDVTNSRKRLRRIPINQLISSMQWGRHTKMDMMMLFQPLLVPPSLSVINAAFCRTDVRAAFNLYSWEGGCRRWETAGKAR
jgi:hypothetical protein